MMATVYLKYYGDQTPCYLHQRRTAHHRQDRSVGAQPDDGHSQKVGQRETSFDIRRRVLRPHGAARKRGVQAFNGLCALVRSILDRPIAMVTGMTGVYKRPPVKGDLHIVLQLSALRTRYTPPSAARRTCTAAMRASSAGTWLSSRLKSVCLPISELAL